MSDKRQQCDAIAADLVATCTQLGSLAAFVRWENGEARIIAPAGFYPQLARLFYRAADLCAERSPPVKP